MKNKAISLIQLAFKAHKISVGDSLIPSIQKRSAQLVLISRRCGQNRKKKLIDKCSYYNVSYIEIEPELFDQISSHSYNSLAICDDGFAKAILKEMKG